MTITQIGKFQILGTLGSGAHSTILHVRRSDDGRQYALKVVPIHDSDDKKYLDQAQHEYRIAQMLDHPTLVKVYHLELVRDWLRRPRKVHLLLEYVNGKTLDTYKRIPIPQLVQVFAKVAGGLVHMHRRRINHADLKPNNLMLSKSGQVKILDYGLAWIKGEPKGRVQGTPEYMAPEQAKKKIVDDRTDMFNFGATMYRLVTWRPLPSVLPAADGLSVEGKYWTRLVKPVQEFVPDAPPELCDLIHRCIAFTPNQRPERMTEIQEILDGLVEKLIASPEERLEAREW